MTVSLESDLSAHRFDTVSSTELARRWRAVSAAMDEAGIDVLVMQNISEGAGGYTRWFSDFPAFHGYPVSVVFERDGTLTVHHHGGGDPHGLGMPALDGARDVPRAVTSPTFITARYCHGYETDALLPVLRHHARGTVGLVGPMQMTASFAEGVRAGLPTATFVDATELVDRVKIVKSDEELAGIRIAARVQESVLGAMTATAVPGVTEYDCVVAGMKRSRELGSDGGTFAVNSAPHGTPAVLQPNLRGSRVLQPGDRLTFLVENNGPGGWYTEIGRTGVLGTADAQLVEQAALAVELQEFTLGLLQPGRPAAEIFEVYSERLRTEGLPPETRAFCHGQGLDIVERPLIRNDEPWTIAGPINMACHPAFVRDGVYTWMCDNVIVAADGSVERLTGTPQHVLELG